MYDTHAIGNGLKLMEHSYLDNDYCKHIISLLHNNPSKLIWLCDYHEPDDITKHTWETTQENDSYKALDDFEDNDYWIINHTKKLYIDIKKLYEIYFTNSADSWYIHPIPLLCNSDTQALGGGDYGPEDSRRATWCEDIISTEFPQKDNLIDFQDITEDCLFYE